jgi:hypothetical protein
LEKHQARVDLTANKSINTDKLAAIGETRPGTSSVISCGIDDETVHQVPA